MRKTDLYNVVNMKIKMCLALLGVFVATVFSLTLPDTCRQETWVTDGWVNDIKIVGDRIYLGGSFATVGKYIGYAIPFDSSATAQPRTGFPLINGPVIKIISDDGGGFYVIGTFTIIGSYTRNKLVHIKADGSVDPVWVVTTDTTVLDIVKSGANIYVCGHFSIVNGVPRNRVAAVDAVTGAVRDWNPGADNYVKVLAKRGTTIYACGQFTTIGGQPRNYLAAIDSLTGNATSWNPNPSAQVNTLSVNGLLIYAGGNFITIGGQSRHGLAALDIGTGNATAWNPNPSNTVSQVVARGNRVYAAGQFGTIGGQYRPYLAALDSVTGNVIAGFPSPDSYVNDIFLADSLMYISGSFIRMGTEFRRHIAAVNLITNRVTSWNPQYSGFNSEVTLSGSTVYISGGGVKFLESQTRNNIAELDATTGIATAWNPSANNEVSSLSANGGKIFAAGYFTSIGGKPRKYLAAIDTITGYATDWNPSPNNNVECVNTNSGIVYAGGRFTAIGGQNRNYIAALDTTVGNALSWNPDANNDVVSLNIHEQTVYATGLFTRIGGQSRSLIAALSIPMGLATVWAPEANDYVHEIVLNGAVIYAIGRFTSIGGQMRMNIAALDTTTGAATIWNPGANGGVYSLATSGNTVFVGGNFSSIGGQPRNFVAAVDATNAGILSWATCEFAPTDIGVNAIALSGTTVYVGGFTNNSIGKGIGHPYFAQFGNYLLAPQILSMSPSIGKKNTGIQTVAIGGLNFRTGATVKLVKAGSPDIQASGLTVPSSTQITGSFNIAGAAYGAWHAVVTNDDFKCDTLFDGFTVTSSSLPSALISPDNSSVNVSLTPILIWRKSTNDSLYTVQMSTAADFSNLLVTANQIVDSFFLVPSGSLLYNTIHYWRVSNTKKGGDVSSFSSPWHFTTLPMMPETPVLLEPANKATNQSLTPVLSWNAASDAATYRLQVVDNDGFGIVVYDDSTIAATSKSIGPLSAEMAYTWHVNAKNVVGTSAWSELKNFTTLPATPGISTLVSPANNATRVPASPRFVWNRVAGTALYSFQIAIDSLFNTIAIRDSTLIDTFLIRGPLANDMRFFWQVKANNAGGSGTWSPAYSFRTIVAEPSKVNLISPISGDTIRAESVLLCWQKSTPQIDRYRVEYAADSFFNPSVVDSMVTDTFKFVHVLQNNRNFWWRVSAHNAAGWNSSGSKRVFCTRFTSVGVCMSVLPKTFAFDASVRTGIIHYALPTDASVLLQVCSMDGRRQSVLQKNILHKAGYYTLNINLNAFATGSYLLDFRAGEYSRKMKFLIMQ